MVFGDKMRSVKLLMLLILLQCNVCLANDLNKTLKICVDNGNWRPFVYQEEGITKGLHIDTINESLKKLDILYEFIPSPWKRCLKGN